MKTVIGIVSVFAVLACSTVVVADEPALRVSLFPYVPSPDGIQKVVEDAWKKLHPDVPLEFVTWDCYSEDPPRDLDVFEFDSIMLDYLVRNSFVSPLTLNEIAEPTGFYDFALRGAMVEGTLYGAPRLACCPMLFYRTGDKAIEAAKSIDDLFAAIGASADSSPIPEEGKGADHRFDGRLHLCVYLP